MKLIKAILPVVGIVLWIALFFSYLSNECGVIDFRTPYRCATVLDFNFRADYSSPWYFLLILGWIPPVAALSYVIVRAIRKTKWWALAGLLTGFILSACWIGLIILTNETHSCAFGFGGMSCFSFWEHFSVNVLILGWVPALIAMIWFLVDGFRWLDGKNGRRTG